MYLLVKCPLCEDLQKTRGKNYFTCSKCKVTYDTEKCLVKEIEDKIYRRRTKVVAEKDEHEFIEVVD